MTTTEPRRTISIVLPAYNEVANLAQAVDDVSRACVDFDDYEIVVVDDGSKDGTGALADELAGTHARVRAIHHPVNRGMAAAYRTGLAQARMEYVTFMGADAEMPWESIRGIVRRAGEADLIVPYHGNPRARTWPRRVFTWVSTQHINLLFGWRHRYYQGPTVYPTWLAQSLPQRIDGFFFACEMLVHARAAGYGWIEVPLFHRERAGGQSKAVSWRNILKAERAILGLWWELRVRGRHAIAPARDRRATGAAT